MELMFLAEDPEIVAERIADAFVSRYNASLNIVVYS
jgi:serine protease inhibitor ecotin